MLANAKIKNKPVMLDFYADWCISCKLMDQTTFANANVVQQLDNFTLLRADVTANDSTDKELERYFDVVAPPTILFFKPDGTEIKNLRVVGEMNAKNFLNQLQQVLNSLK